MADRISFFSHMELFPEYGCTLVSVILGYELGLFNKLKDSKKPLTSTELANIAGYKERYVREWLGAMSAAKVISVQTNEDQEDFCVYHLPKEHFDVVESCAIFGKGAFACHNRMGVLKSCFRKDGPQGDTKAFQGEDWEFFEELREKTGEREMLNDILPKVESVSDYKAPLEKGCKVLDFGCGSGTFTLCMAEHYPMSTFTGLDITDDCIQRARIKSERKGLSNVTFTKTTLEALIEDSEEQLDVVTAYQVIHNLPDPNKMIRNLHSLLKPSGKLILIETALSSNHLHNVGNMSDAFNYSLSLFYCLLNSMSDNPHTGFGFGWGMENLLKSLDEYFLLDASFKHEYSTCLYLLSKRVN